MCNKTVSKYSITRKNPAFKNITYVQNFIDHHFPKTNKYKKFKKTKEQKHLQTGGIHKTS